MLLFTKTLSYSRPSISLYFFNSLAPGKFEWNFRYLIFQIISVIDGWVITCELALRWMLLDITDDKSTLVQVMAWCHQATSHYLSQCWPRSLSPYGVTRPKWINTLRHRQNSHYFADNIFTYIFLNETILFWLKFHWSLFYMVPLTIFHHWVQ